VDQNGRRRAIEQIRVQAVGRSLSLRQDC
jgi:hypothetical protein